MADGSFKLRGMSTTLRLSDPNGVFGKASNASPFFPVDDENPSITAFSGYPMCFPRSDNDPKCPASNRPAGSTNFSPADPLAMVPFLVGDFITYTAVPKNGELLVFEASSSNVQVTTTASDTVPNYIFVEDAIIGIADPNPNVEIADTRVSLTDDTRSVLYTNLHSSLVTFLAVPVLQFRSSLSKLTRALVMRTYARSVLQSRKLAMSAASGKFVLDHRLHSLANM